MPALKTLIYRTMCGFKIENTLKISQTLGWASEELAQIHNAPLKEKSKEKQKSKIK